MKKRTKKEYHYDLPGLMGWLITRVSKDFTVQTLREVGSICNVCPTQLSRWINMRVAPTWDAVINMMMEANQQAELQQKNFHYELKGMPPELVKKETS